VSQVELLVTLILFSLIGSAAARTALSAARTTRAAGAKVAAQSALDGGLWYFARELGELGRDTTSTDLLSQAAESLTYRALRGLGLACRVTASSVDLPIQDLSASRLPQTGRDSLLLLALDDSTGAYTWVPAPILGVGATTCGVLPAVRLSTLLDTSRVSFARLPRLVPVRIHEIMQVRLYASQGATWLGARSVSAGENIQPLVGPFDARASRFELFDSAGLVSGSVGSTRELRLTLTAPWLGWAGTGLVARDTADLRLAPENFLR